MSGVGASTSTCRLIDSVSNLVKTINEMNDLQRGRGGNDTNDDETHVLHRTMPMPMPQLLRIPLVKVKTDHGPIKVCRYTWCTHSLLHIFIWGMTLFECLKRCSGKSLRNGTSLVTHL